MPNITAPTFNSYSEFKASEYYEKAMAKNAVEYLFYINTPAGAKPSQQLPITKGESASWGGTMEKYEIDQWGKSVIEEFADGKFRIAGNIGIFYTPQQADALPTSQDWLGVRYVIVKRVAPGYPGAGIVLAMVTNVALNQKDYNASGRGLIMQNLRFMASREYSGEECEALGIK